MICGKLAARYVGDFMAAAMLCDELADVLGDFPAPGADESEVPDASEAQAEALATVVRALTFAVARAREALRGEQRVYAAPVADAPMDDVAAAPVVDCAPEWVVSDW